MQKICCLIALFLWLLAALPARAQGINTTGANDLPLGAGGFVSMTVENGTGYIGIGTKTPQTWLQITGTGGTNIDFATTGQIRTGTDGSGGTGGVWVGPNQFFGSFDATRVGIYNNGWDFTIQSNGAVGIGAGNTAPQSELDVAGGMKIGSDTVCNSAKAGTISWTNGSLNVCNGSTWTALPIQQ
jgi:hypothetical protein